jgi:glucosamine kinase
MDLYLGIDGGGTGCRAAVADASGRVLGQGVAGPANIASDLSGARDSILAATEAALSEAGCADVPLPALHVGMGLAGANAQGASADLRRSLPFARLRIETDAVAAAMGALGGRDGIVAAIGTGSVYARQSGGTIRQIGGWGLVLGDQGSGAWLGRGLLSEVLAADDGFRAMTPLLRQTHDEMGGKAGIIAFSLSARPADFAALAPPVLASDDPVAHILMAEATDHIAAAITVLQGDRPVPVTFIGGLGAVFAGRLSTRWQIAPAVGSAVDGALILAREAA